MLRYVECGTAFTAEYGDIDEVFYSSLESMFDETLNGVVSLPPTDRAAPLRRLARVVDQAGAVGWGYQDSIGDALCRAFPDFAEDGPNADD